VARAGLCSLTASEAILAASHQLRIPACVCPASYPKLFLRLRLLADRDFSPCSAHYFLQFYGPSEDACFVVKFWGQTGGES